MAVIGSIVVSETLVSGFTGLFRKMRESGMTIAEIKAAADEMTSEIATCVEVSEILIVQQMADRA